MPPHVSPGDARFTRGLAALARVTTSAGNADISALDESIIRDTVASQPAVIENSFSQYGAGNIVRVMGEARRNPGARMAGELVECHRAPDTMVVGPEHVEPDWLMVKALLADLGMREDEHPKLYPFVAPGVLETYYVLPHLRRMYVVLDWNAVLAKDAVRRLRPETGTSAQVTSLSLVQNPVPGNTLLHVKLPGRAPFTAKAKP